LDKIFTAPELEMCAECGDPNRRRVERGPWLRQAARNLDRGEQQIVRLQKMALPPVLEPVREYLLGWLRVTLGIQQARYRYVADGDVQPLREYVQAHCGPLWPDDRSTLIVLESTPFEERPEASWTWPHNRVLACYMDRGSYPTAAWNAFLSEYGLREWTVSTIVD
jgi:hypothetical protein